MEQAKRVHEALVARVIADLRKRWAPASAAEAKWVGYDLRVRRYTKEERDFRRAWRWMNGYWGAGATEEMLNDPKVWGAYTQVHRDLETIRGKRFYGVDGKPLPPVR
jgi:hypothetical protein